MSCDKKNKLSAYFFWLIAILALALPALMIWELIRDGLFQLSFRFLFTSPEDSGRSGGIFSLIISTLWILSVCLMAAVPLGLGCALFLSECVLQDTKISRLIGLSLDVLSGIPSIIFGLFGYAVFSIYLGFGSSILSGGLSLACMVLPLFIRTCEHTFRACPSSYRQSATALNLSLFGFIWRVLLPCSTHGIGAALAISVGRAIAETAVLIFTSGYVSRMPNNWFDSGRALSVHIYDLSMNVPGGQSNASGTAIVLLAVVVIINMLTRKLLSRL